MKFLILVFFTIIVSLILISCEDIDSSTSADLNISQIPEDMVLIESKQQKFIMGSDTTFDVWIGGVDTPSHEVLLTKNFLIGKTEVTQKEYSELMDINPSEFTYSDSLPVENCTWNEAIIFCNKKSIKEGLDTVYSFQTQIPSESDSNIITNVTIDYSKNGYRLPTEAEWEYAYRANTTSNFYWGDYNKENIDNVNKYAWCMPESDSKTHPVGRKFPNQFGLYDMAGNVWEWCNDWGDYYSNSSVIDPSGPKKEDAFVFTYNGYTGVGRTLRGGAFYKYQIPEQAVFFRASTRGLHHTFHRFNSVGFRVVRTFIK